LIELKNFRRKKKLTQSQLAQLIGSSLGYIHEIEVGKKTPSLAMIYKLAHALEVCPKDLIKCECNTCVKCYNDSNDVI
jgi:transcriptional regulator with XRE-family HTH domain